jgi:hypothetical protein
MFQAVLLAAFAAPPSCVAAATPLQNIVRAQPSESAAQAGQSIAWRDSLSGALEESKETGKPVFWYVTSVDGSFMDRSPEIDRMMMAGPMSWPRIIDLLEEHFIPVRGRAGAQTGAKYGLVRLDFIEPGWIVLDGEGQEIARRDRLNTFHPGQFGEPLARIADIPWEVHNPYPGTTLTYPIEAAFHVRFQRPNEARSPLAEYERLETTAERAEALYLHACGLQDHAMEEAAQVVWRKIADVAPDHPLAAAAAMEAEGLGPYVRGMASFDLLPVDALAEAPTSQVPPGAFTEGEVWLLATRFLVRMQRSDGGWDDSIYDFGGTDSLPNVYVATSALCMQALMEAYARGLGDSHRPLPTVLAPGHRYVVDDANLALEDADEIAWAYIYRIGMLSRRLDDELSDPVHARIAEDLGVACQALVGIQGDGGAWRHEYANPFVTASALVALHAAKEHGVEPEGLEDAVALGIEALRRCRTAEVAYSYGMPRGAARAAVAGSVGRAPLGELALQLWGVEDADLAGAVERSFRDEESLFRARKYDDHTNLHGYGGFFFWYSMYARSRAIAALEDDAVRREHARAQKQRLLALAEFDGAFVDSHELGRSYGTAIALLCLAALDDALGVGP